MNEIFTYPLIPGLLVLVAVLAYFFQKPEFETTSIGSTLGNITIPKWVFGVIVVVGIPSLLAFYLAPLLVRESFSGLAYLFLVMPTLVVMSVVKEIIFRRNHIARISCSFLMIVLVAWITTSRVYWATISHRPFNEMQFIYIFIILSVLIPALPMLLVNAFRKKC